MLLALRSANTGITSVNTGEIHYKHCLWWMIMVQNFLNYNKQDNINGLEVAISFSI